MNIITEENNLLRKKSVPILKESPKYMNNLIHNMIDLLIESKGVGLAAPQVGVNKRVFIAVLDLERIEVFVNPVILSCSEEMELDEEGCLSVPGKVGDVLRHKSITIRYFNGKEIKTATFEGLNARIIQHEYDHLNGVLYTDKAEAIRDREPIEKSALIEPTQTMSH